MSPEGITSGISMEDKAEERSEIIHEINQVKVGSNPAIQIEKKDPLHTISLLNEYSDKKTISPGIKRHLWVSCLLI